MTPFCHLLPSSFIDIASLELHMLFTKEGVGAVAQGAKGQSSQINSTTDTLNPSLETEKPISCDWSLSIPTEDIRKPEVF